MSPPLHLFNSTLLVLPVLAMTWGCGAGNPDENTAQVGAHGSDGGQGAVYVSPGNEGLGEGIVGSPCDLSFANAKPSQAVYNAQASECYSRICLKPLDQVGVDTSSFCSSPCQTDSDCNGVRRSPDNPSDKRCMSGFTCGVAFVVGPLCCKPICLCKDFMAGSTAAIPQMCLQDGQPGCQEP
jgi:hypothetical protein